MYFVLSRLWIWLVFSVVLHSLVSANDKATATVAPPAGRYLLYRTPELTAMDFPLSHAHLYDAKTRRLEGYAVTGPKEFWTIQGLQQHYSQIGSIRYPEDVYKQPPPFQYWLAEQRMIRAIHLQEELLHVRLEEGLIGNGMELLELEVARLEMYVRLRYFQIKVALKYARLDPMWKQYEELALRLWSGLVEIFDRRGAQTLKKGQANQHMASLKAELEKVTKEIDKELKEHLATMTANTDIAATEPQTKSRSQDTAEGHQARPHQHSAFVESLPGSANKQGLMAQVPVRPPPMGLASSADVAGTSSGATRAEPILSSLEEVSEELGSLRMRSL